MRALILFLAIGAAQPQAQPGTAGVIRGQVRSEGTGAPLRYATVELIGFDGRDEIRAQTDANGYYVLRDVPEGRRLLRATHIDHAPLEVQLLVGPGARLVHDFYLVLRPVVLPTVSANASVLVEPRPPDSAAVRPADLGTAAVRVLEATPGVAEFALAEAARAVPGHEPPDPTDVLFVRGASTDLKLILLNGAPVFAPFHIGGLISAMDPDMVGSATLHVGGASARWDGGLSYVMDMETRGGRSGRPRAEVGADMLSARIVAEGPVGRHGAYLVGGRNVHGFGAAPFIDEPFPYGYGDGIGRVDFDLGGGRSLTATGFWNRERVRIDSAGVVDGAAEWGNLAGSLRYHGELAGGEAMVTLGVGGFDTRLPLSGTQPLFTEGRSRRTRLTGDFTRRVGDARVFFGGSVDHLEFANRVWARGSLEEDGVVREATGGVAGVYVDAVVVPIEGLRVRGGVRADVFTIDFEPRLAPRLSASMDIGERATLTVAGGRYRQYVRAQDLSQTSVSATVPDEPPPPLKVAQSAHYVVSLDQRVGEDLQFTVEGFYKSFSGLPEENGREDAEASGLDVWVRRAGRVTGWFGYSLAWIWYTPEERPFNGDSFAGRHLISAGFSTPIAGSGSIDVRVAYGAGMPYTAIPEPELTSPVLGVAFRPSGDDPATPASIARPDDPYLRLDAQIQRTWQGDWLGVAFAVTPYVRVLNALDRRDALFYHLERSGEGTELRALASLPVLPVLGMEWRF